MKRNRRLGPPVTMLSGFTGFRFPPEVILLAVRWYLRYGLSYRDLEELLAERGIEVDHVTLYRWVQRFTPPLIDAARPVRHLAGDRWFVEETYVKVAGVWRYLYRAVDQQGQVIDVYVSRRRDIAAARTFFTAALTVHGDPGEVITDRSPALANVVEELLPAALHNTGQYENNRVECDHGRLKGPTPADARAEDESHDERGDPRARLHPEPPPRPLRTRSRRHTGVPLGHRIRRTPTSHLISTGPRSRLCMACDRTTQQSRRRR
jgi:transposase-like protein